VAPPSGNEITLFQRHRRDADPAARERLIERFLPLAGQIARRYDRTGQAFEDIYQVACLAIGKAVDRYDPDRGSAFSSFAVPTVEGEVKRYFRDQTWAVHMPRDLQERCLRVTRVITELSGRLGREPTVQEVAGEAGCTDEDALEALGAATAYRAESLEAPPGAGDEQDVTLGETIGAEDARFGRVEQRADLAVLVDRLTARERTALALRFEYGLTQPEIGRVLGIPPIHVSRLLRGSLERLRRLAAADPADPRCPRADSAATA
jgi:RNA polymerase sigma-B factor